MLYFHNQTVSMPNKWQILKAVILGSLTITPSSRALLYLTLTQRESRWLKAISTNMYINVVILLYSEKSLIVARLSSEKNDNYAIATIKEKRQGMQPMQAESTGNINWVTSLVCQAVSSFLSRPCLH